MTRGMFRLCTVVIWITLLRSGGVSTEDTGEAGESQSTKQEFYFPRNNIFPPQRRIPQFSQSPYIPRPIPFIPQPWRNQQRTQTRQSSQSIEDVVLVLYIYNLIERSRKAAEEAAAEAAAAAAAALATTTSTTTASTTIATTTECPFGQWGACDSVCLGKRTRQRTCSSATESEPCNTQLGLQPSGWYRSSNCMEYFVVDTPVSFYDATSVSGCDVLDNTILASTGVRDVDVRTDIMIGLHSAGQPTKLVWVGAFKSGSSTTYDWGDRVSGTISFWDANEPGTDPCVSLTLGNPNSARDQPCSDSHAYLCERPAQ